MLWENIFLFLRNLPEEWMYLRRSVHLILLSYTLTSPVNGYLQLIYKIGFIQEHVGWQCINRIRLSFIFSNFLLPLIVQNSFQHEILIKQIWMVMVAVYLLDILVELNISASSLSICYQREHSNLKLRIMLSVRTTFSQSQAKPT